MGDATTVAALAAAFVGIGLLSGRLRGSPVTISMVALATGLVLGPVAGLLPDGLEERPPVALLAELTLAVVLFVDATRVDVRLARHNGQLPGRMLLIGLPLVVLAGTGAGVLVLDIDVVTAFLLACLLAPTDAALGQPLLVDERVPRRVRQALNVESGLNDGLVVPFFTVALVLAGVEAEAETPGGLLLDAVQLIGIGAVVGVAVGGGVAWLLRLVDWHRLVATSRQVGVAATPLLAWGAATALGGNGFVAAFVAGVAFGATLREAAHELVEFGEDIGEAASLLTIIVFGAVVAGPVRAAIGPLVLLYVALQLTLVRMVPIAVSLAGLGLHRATTGLLGWFGPRGLATMVFGLEVLELAEAGELPGGEQVFAVAALTVVTSVVIHGATAAPLAGAYGRRYAEVAAGEQAMVEDVHVADVPMRTSWRREP